MVAQRGRPRSPAGRRRREPRRTATPAGRRTAPARRRRGRRRSVSTWRGALSPRPGHRRAVVAGRPGARGGHCRPGLEPRRGGVGSQLTPFADRAHPHSYLWVDRRGDLVGAGERRGRISATLPSGRSTTVAGITLGTFSAAAISRRPSCTVGSAPQLGQPQQRGGLVLVLMHRQHRHVRPHPLLVLGHRGQLVGARRAPVRPQVQHDGATAHRPGDIDGRTVARALEVMPRSASGPHRFPAAGTAADRRAPADRPAPRRCRRRGDPARPGPVVPVVHRLVPQLGEQRRHERGDDDQHRNGPARRRAHGRLQPGQRQQVVGSGPLSAAAAVGGSVGPMPNDGQSLASTQTPQAGRRARTRRPWKITRWLSCVHSLRSMSHRQRARP